jgi:hypothetical protein
MDRILDIRTASIRISRITKLGAQSHENVPNTVACRSRAVVVVVVAARRHARLGAAVCGKVGGVGYVVGIESVRLTAAIAIAELADGVLGHLWADLHVRAFGDVAGIFVLRVAGEDVGARWVVAECSAVVLVGDCASVLVQGAVCVAVVDGLGEIADAGVLRGCVRAATLTATSVNGGECELIDLRGLIICLQD